MIMPFTQILSSGEIGMTPSDLAETYAGHLFYSKLRSSDIQSSVVLPFLKICAKFKKFSHLNHQDVDERLTEKDFEVIA